MILLEAKEMRDDASDFAQVLRKRI